MATLTEHEFGERAERHRRELHVHCYRMLGSFEAADDAVQETLLRAWRARSSLERDEWFRAWLYKIATNACLDAIKRDERRVPSLGSMRDVPWLQPYPDRLLEDVAPSDEQPDTALVERETIELAFLAVIQLLPPRQRAVLILREVLDWSAADVALQLDMPVAAVNSALQRARATLREHLPTGRREEWHTPQASERERVLLEGFIRAHETADAELALSMCTDDIRITMPPMPLLYEGREAIMPLLTDGLTLHRHLAPGTDQGQPDADRRQLPARPRRRHVPGLQVRRPAHRGRQDRRDHHLRRAAVRGVRPAAHPRRRLSARAWAASASGCV